jgi:hypothetical protein
MKSQHSSRGAISTLISVLRESTQRRIPMTRFLFIGATIVGAGLWLAAPANSETQRCRNAQGHFIACPPAHPATTPAPTTTAAAARPATQRCRNAQGHFIACGSTPARTTTASSNLPAGITRDRNGRCHGAGGRFVVCPH